MIDRWLLLALAALATGCGKPEAPPTPVVEHDEVAITEADVKLPANYAEALPWIKDRRDTIRTVLEAGTPGKAHRALDELDIIFDKLPSIAKASGIPLEKWETVNLSAQQLRNQFDQVHAAIDAERAPDFSAVAEPIDRAIANLEQVAP
jgi:hypothetical protein